MVQARVNEPAPSGEMRTMQVIYFHMYGGNARDGINKKILAQASRLYETGIRVNLVLVGGINDTCQDHTFLQILPPYTGPGHDILFFKRLYRQHLARTYIRSVIREAGPDTVLYLRYPVPIFVTPRDMTHKKTCRVVLECNSIEIKEQKQQKYYLKYLYELAFGRAFRKSADAIVGVTDEITRYQVARSGDPDKPHITIGNGFDVDSVRVRVPPEYSGEELSVLCVANVSRWHGLDRMLKGMSAYNGPFKIRFHIAGDGPDAPYLKKIASEMEITDSVTFHGFKTGEDLDRLFNQCHIAVGSLGIYRKGLSQTSELKAREYCARGIPSIIACQDPDFPDDYPYVLQVPADDTPIDIEQVLAFAQEVCTDPEHPETMRAYARDNLDWLPKMEKLKTFLETIVESR
jgi:hypothetical protein